MQIVTISEALHDRFLQSKPLRLRGLVHRNGVSCRPEKREPIELVLATADVLSEGAEGAGGERELFKFSLTTLSF